MLGMGPASPTEGLGTTLASIVVFVLSVGSAETSVMVPLTLRRLSIDPALSAGVILTTFTDCIGFATLLGLGTLFLT